MNFIVGWAKRFILPTRTKTFQTRENHGTRQRLTQIPRLHQRTAQAIHRHVARAWQCRAHMAKASSWTHRLQHPRPTTHDTTRQFAWTGHTYSTILWHRPSPIRWATAPRPKPRTMARLLATFYPTTWTHPRPRASHRTDSRDCQRYWPTQTHTWGTRFRTLHRAIRPTTPTARNHAFIHRHHTIFYPPMAATVPHNGRNIQPHQT